MKILITGVAGFIGFHLSKFLLAESNFEIIGIDNLNNYYDLDLKKARLLNLKKNPYFIFKKLDLCNKKSLRELFCFYKPDYVVHLAAQAGVRYSLQNPEAYINSNIVGFFNLLEECKRNKTKHLIFASSSSVYGKNDKFPFKVSDNTDRPSTIYAASKKTNELLAYSYSSLYKLPTTGLRFFTVYGPWGRPDMAYFLFTDAIYKNKTIQVFNNGEMYRDFTYIDDVINVINKIIKIIPKQKSNKKNVPFQIFNVGNHKPVKLKKLIEIIEQNIGKKAKKVYLPMQPGEVYKTYSDNDDLQKKILFSPKMTINEGIKRFIDWYKEYYGNIT